MIKRNWRLWLGLVMIAAGALLATWYYGNGGC